MKFLRVIKAIFLLAYVGFLAVVCISPLQQTAAVESDAEPRSTASPLQIFEKIEKIDFAAGSFPEDSESLTLTVEADEVDLLDGFTQLKSVDLSGSTCYEEILAWADKHPEVEVTYTVELPDGSAVGSGTETLDLSALTAEQAEAAIPLLSWLPKLQEITLGSVGADKSFTGERVAAIREQLPEVKLNYSVTLMGQEVDPEIEELDLTELPHEEVPGVVALLGDLPNLKYINLGANGGNITWEDVNLFRDARPDVQLGYSFDFWGKTINFSDETLNYSHVYMGDEGDSVRWLVPYMHNLTYIDMDTCGISNEAMGKLREDFPNVEFVWRVNFAQGYSVRTNVIKILASKPSKAGYITDQDAQVLKYCTKLKYLDVGHNETLHDISFCSYMPDLEVVIFTMTGVTDISPLADCPHLEYLEVTHTQVSDLSPLANAKELRHLNVGDTRVSDIQALYGLTDLERLWLCMGTNVPYDQVEYMRQCAPNCEINLDADDPSLGAWRFSDLNDDGWAYFVKTGYFKFVNHPRYELLRQQFGYDNEEYSFYWLDPLY